MPVAGFTDFNPATDIPSLQGKVVLITGGSTTGVGKATVEALASHEPEHIYFTGRNAEAAESIIQTVTANNADTALTFLEIDQSSLASVQAGVSKFTHDRLDILVCNAGVMELPPCVTEDGVEIHMAINHLAHAAIIHLLLPTLLRTAELPESDVRIVSVASNAWFIRSPFTGIWFDKLSQKMDGLWEAWARYGQSKLAMIVYARELANRHPNLMAVSLHPGILRSKGFREMPFLQRYSVYIYNFFGGVLPTTAEKAALNQLWTAAGAKRDDLVNGAFYFPIGVLYNHKLDHFAKSDDFARKVWNWTAGIMDKRFRA